MSYSASMPRPWTLLVLLLTVPSCRASPKAKTTPSPSSDKAPDIQPATLDEPRMDTQSVSPDEPPPDIQSATPDEPPDIQSASRREFPEPSPKELAINVAAWCRKIKRTDTDKIGLRASKLSGRSARLLEKKLARVPDNVELRTELLLFYSRATPIDASRAYSHILFLAKHQPEAWVLESPEQNSSLGQARATELAAIWQRHLAGRGVPNGPLLANAATFFSSTNPTLAETLYRQALREDPDRQARYGKTMQKQRRALRSEAMGLSCPTSAADAAALWLSAERAFRLTAGLQSPDLSRFLLLGEIAWAGLAAGKIVKAATYARQLLALSPQFRGNWNYGNAIHDAHTILGRIALRQRDIPSAKKHLLDAGMTPGSPQLDSFGPTMALAAELLALGESEVVLSYFQLCARFWDQRRLKQWSAAVRMGKRPTWLMNLR